MKLTATVKGLAPLLANIARLRGASAPEESLETLKAAAEPIHALAVSFAPYDVHDRDGIHLRDHIIIAERETDEGFVAVDVGTDRQAPHGHLLELGTVKMAARPFLRPAFDVGQADGLVILKRRIWESVMRAIRS